MQEFKPCKKLRNRDGEHYCSGRGEDILMPRAFAHECLTGKTSTGKKVPCYKERRELPGFLQDWHPGTEADHAAHSG